MRGFAVFGLLVALHAGGQTDPRTGSWTLVSAQSSLEPANRLTITTVPGGTHIAMTGQTRMDVTVNLNGKQAAAPGNLGFNQIELHRVSKKEAAVLEKKDGALVATVKEKLSADANELTTTTVMPGKTDEVSVWERTGGAKMPKDPFSGEWMQDMSKSRTKQGLQLKIEPDGRGGTRYTGDYSYTARFDGKPSDLHGSRNDTVALTLADAHTVDATYLRDGQVAQKDRWTVDGPNMTVTSAGSLETGQKFTEKLVFKKQ